MLRSIGALVTVLLLAAGIGGAYWQFVMKPKAQQAAAAQGHGAPGNFAMPVEGRTVRVGPRASAVTAIGTLMSNETVTIRPEISGRVSQILFAEGQKVRQGEALLEIDSVIQKAELTQAKANLALSKQNFERAEELAKRGAGTQRALDEAVAKLRVDEANVLLAQTRFEKYTLSAPFEGIAGLRKVSLGAYLAPGQDVVNIESVDPIKVDFRVPELYLSVIKVGQAIAVTVDAFPGRSFAGEVYAIDPLIDQTGRSIVIRARIPNRDDALRPGLFTRVVLELERAEQAVFVPEQTLIPQGANLIVYRVTDGKVEAVPVKIGLRRQGEVEVLEGLKAGDVVVTAGQLKVGPGMPVMVMPTGNPGGGTQPGQAPARS